MSWKATAPKGEVLVGCTTEAALLENFKRHTKLKGETSNVV